MISHAGANIPLVQTVTLALRQRSTHNPEWVRPLSAWVCHSSLCEQETKTSRKAPCVLSITVCF